MKCRICNRPLKNPVYIKMGIGPICAKRLALDKAFKQQAGDDDEIVPYDGGPIWIERRPAPTLQVVPGGFESVDQIHYCSGIVTNVPRQIYRHSPTGYNFGYQGSGPADFALNVCLLFCSQPADAYRLYQEFKRDFVSKESSPERLEIPADDIKAFLRLNGAAIRQ